MKEYKKPQVKFVNLRGRESVADTCWGLDEKHNKQKERFIDVSGPGYVGFNVKGSGSCGNPDAYNIKYYEYKGAIGDTIKGKEYEDELEAMLRLKGGADGNPYKGLDFDFPDKPVEGWS